jgi:predicted component of type VI protein secretion system
MFQAVEGPAIEVEELEARPGAYRAVAVSRPQFQLNDPTVSLRIVINIRGYAVPK